MKQLHLFLKRTGIVLFFSLITILTKGQEGTITGTVTDAKAAGLSGASVVLKSTGKGTITNASGSYNWFSDRLFRRWLHSGCHHRGGGSKAERCRVSRAATDCYASRVPYSSDRVHRDCILMRSQAALGCNRIRFWHG